MDIIINCIKSINKRPSWDEYFMNIAHVVSMRSTCNRLHVGCVIVDNNIIVATGYNGHTAHTPHESIVVDDHEQMTIHAEINALSNLRSFTVSPNTIAYITHYPCLNCAKALRSFGITKFVYNEDYKNNILVEKFMFLLKKLPNDCC